ncbi:MAG TPA: hypothetical protein VNM67_17100 [Thermoanaerobaculia bacterium]|jgi:hypothetical protein|nr:hypothetical protein [Thermoanaerobaculia bacterium]
MKHLRALALPALLLATLYLSVRVAKPLYLHYLVNERTPMWDMAGNGYGGVELLQALSEGRVFRFLQRLNAQDKWPFGYSLLLLPFLAAGGSTFASATWLSLVLFAMTPPLLVWVAHEADRKSGMWGGLAAAGLFMASPLHRVLAIVVMRELAGVVFTLLALGLYLRARRFETLRAWRLAGLASLALFLIKVNYALIWGLCVAVDQLWGRRTEVLRGIRRLLWPWPGATRGQAALAVVLGLLLICAVVGINPGIGVYALILVFTGIAVARWQCFRSWWQSLPPAPRALLETFVLPVWIWCLSPNPIHPKNIYAFLRNRATGPPLYSLESIGFYVRSLTTHYAPEAIIGVAVIGLAIVGAWRSRVVALLAGLGWLLATLHPYKEARFFATTAPFFFLLAGIGLAAVFARWRVTLAAVVCIAALLSLVSKANGLEDRLRRDYLLYSADPRYADPLELLQRKAAGRGRVALIGTFNELSDNLVRWSLAQKNIELARSLQRPQPGEVPRQLAEWLEREKPRRILALRLLPRSPLFQGPDFQRYNAWQLEALKILQADPSWQETRARRFRELDLEIMVLDRKGQFPSEPE